MRRLLPLVVVLLAALPAQAAPTAYQTWKKQQKVVDKQEAHYWDGYGGRLNAMYGKWQELWALWRGDPDFYKDEVDDIGVLRDLYAEYAGIQEARAEIDLNLARSGDVAAAEHLLEALFDVVKAQEKLEKQLAEERPKFLYNYYDQEPGVRLHGAAVRVRGLVQALAACAGAVEFLGGEGWTKAEKGDKRRTAARRGAVLDALGATKADEARAVLGRRLAAPEPAVRAMAVDNLVPYGAAAIEVLRPLLADPSGTVRRALLEQIAKDAVDVPAWIPIVFEVYAEQKGLVRARALEALVALTRNHDLGDDVTKWRAWVEQNRQVIQDGTWVPPEPEKPDPKKKPEAGKETAPAVVPTAVTSFYGVGAASDQLVFVLDGTSDMLMPADLQTQQKKSRRSWLRTRARWKELYVNHVAVMLQELARTLELMPAEARFAVFYLTGGIPDRVPVYGDRKPLAPTKAGRKKLLKAIGKPEPNGTMSAEEGLRRTFALRGHLVLENPGPKDADLDTVFLLHTGWVGGRWGVPEALVAEFERKNRSHRLQVHAIRIADRKAEAEALMKGLAEASGGTYLWLEELPEY